MVTKAYQSIAEAIGKTGCLYLSILHMYGLDELALSLYPKLVERELIDANCTILDHQKLCSYLNSLSAKKIEYCGWSKSEGGDFSIAEYRKDRQTHFVIVKDSKVVYDPLENSKTTKFGSIESYRNYRYVSN